MTDITLENWKAQKFIEEMNTQAESLRQQMKRQYNRGIIRDLSLHNTNGMLRRNMTSVLNTIYKESLSKLQAQNSDIHSGKSEEDLSSTVIEVLKPYDGIIEELLQYAINFHRSSCALSNFPDEHHPTGHYIGSAIDQATKDWEDFAMQVNHIMTAPA